MSPWRALGASSVLLLAVPGGGAAADRGAASGAANAPASPDLRARPDAIFDYVSPQLAHPWRAAAEIGAGLAFQFAVYLNHPSSTAVESEERYSPADKLVHGAWSFDANRPRTNYLGHPLAGAFYYLVARGNRLGMAGSSLAAIAGSTVWELTEHNEQGSINDMIVTPVGGIALGEPLARLSSFFEQRDAGTGDRVLAWVLQPFKKAHDLWDGAVVARRPEALASGDFRLSALAGAARRGDGTAAIAGAAVSARLVRGGGYGRPGNDAARLGPGDVVRMAADVVAARDGIAAARLESDVALLARYSRDLDGDDTPSGQDLLLGAGVGLDVAARAFDPALPTDWLTLVHVPGASAEWRRIGTGLPLLAAARAAMTFGGVRSLVLAADPAAAAPEDLPTAARGYGYYHALGFMASARLEASVGPVALGAGARIDDLYGFDAGVHDAEPLPGANPATLRDRRGEAEVSLRWALGGVALGAALSRAWAEGRVAAARRSAGMTGLLLSVELRRR